MVTTFFKKLRKNSSEALQQTSTLNAVLTQRSNTAHIAIKSLAAQEAHEILNAYWDGNFSVDPVSIARRAGVEVYDADLEQGYSSFLEKKAGATANIYLSRSVSTEKRRYDCAHQLGHCVDRAQAGQDEYGFVSTMISKPGDPFEWYADHFARNLLMPEGTVRELAIEYKYPVTALAEFFGVAESTMRLRLYDLGLHH